MSDVAVVPSDRAVLCSVSLPARSNTGTTSKVVAGVMVVRIPRSRFDQVGRKCEGVIGARLGAQACVQALVETAAPPHADASAEALPFLILPEAS